MVDSSRNFFIIYEGGNLVVAVPLKPSEHLSRPLILGVAGKKGREGLILRALISGKFHHSREDGHFSSGFGPCKPGPRRN